MKLLFKSEKISFGVTTFKSVYPFELLIILVILGISVPLNVKFFLSFKTGFSAVVVFSCEINE